MSTTEQKNLVKKAKKVSKQFMENVDNRTKEAREKGKNNIIALQGIHRR